MPINIIVLGAAGSMGKAVLNTVLTNPALWLVGAVDHNWVGKDAATALGHPSPCNVQVQASLADTLAQLPTDAKPLVGIDFTTPRSVYANAVAMIEAGIHPLIGATGLTPEQHTSLDEKLKAAGLAGAVIPNFAIGAVLMMKFAAMAAKYFDHAEIIELHHNKKLDAPSGTALLTAQAMLASQPNGCFATTNRPDSHESFAGARGATLAGNLHVHSIRLPGLVAHQEVLLGSQGELLTLRHDAFDRTCFMPGVTLAAKRLPTMPVGLTVGLDAFLE
jgi:4-hydroxy-tetrahydrodipicolinate reductase